MEIRITWGQFKIIVTEAFTYASKKIVGTTKQQQAIEILEWNLLSEGAKSVRYSSKSTEKAVLGSKTIELSYIMDREHIISACLADAVSTIKNENHDVAKYAAKNVDFAYPLPTSDDHFFISFEIHPKK